ncbi:MAG: OB-fold nucleic acid binding domain-containing protein [Myxococcaceae bacterium]|nr:OB-fold nucleic acid binding domain-containing protein [Myxococcaceae bacterium]
MSETETETPNSPADEQIRKIYAKDLKSGEVVHTVFKATRKEKAASRAGKPYLSLTLTDRTGEVDGRVFENVEAADGAFTTGDYLLLKGRIGSFHGKSQIVIDRLERLDPEPIDPKEFEFTAPPAPPAGEPKEKEKERRAEKPERHEDDAPTSHKAARQRLLKLLDNPTIALGLDALLAQLEKQIEDRVVARLSGQPVPTHGPGPRVEKKPRPPRPERGDGPRPTEPPKPEAPRRDASLPEGLAFKPFKALVGDGETPSGGA